MYFGYESQCALFEYRGRILNIKLFAAVVYFSLVDFYSCMISNMLETERIKKTKILSHQLKLPLFKTGTDGRGLLKPVMEVVVFNSHANTSNMHGAR